MYGEDGWCKGCGVPLREQSGSLVLQRRNLTCSGAWVPNWQHDVVCIDASLGEEVASRFDVDLRVVTSPNGDDCGLQIVPRSVGDAWFDPVALATAARLHHGTDGARCAVCDTWRWMPIPADSLPTWQMPPEALTLDVAASPEWFGDGWSCFREVIFRQGLADFIASASPRDFVIREVAFAR